MCNFEQHFRDALSHHENATKWTGATYEKMKKIPNTKVGAVGQDFIESICNELGFVCEFPVNNDGSRATQSPWDLKINGITFELKTATEDTNGNFQFNHVRYHRPYQAVLCLGVSPEALYFNLWSKADVVTGKAGNLVSMEKWANASYKLTKRPAQLYPINLFQEKLQEFIDEFKT
jgi:hypothetical protein